MRRVLLDHCVPRPFRNMLTGCDVSTTHEMGWAEFKNGELIKAAENAGFDIFITADKNLRYQQNLSERRIAVIELPTNRLTHRIMCCPGKCSYRDDSEWKLRSRDVAHAAAIIAPRPAC